MEKKLILHKYLRLTIYSFLRTKELAFKIALLSKLERDILPSSGLIGSKRLHLILKGSNCDSTLADYLVNYAYKVTFYIN